jgi:hypothetical protein
MLFKALMIQSMHNLPDDQLDFQISDFDSKHAGKKQAYQRKQDLSGLVECNTTQKTPMNRCIKLQASRLHK